MRHRLVSALVVSLGLLGGSLPAAVGGTHAARSASAPSAGRGYAPATSIGAGGPIHGVVITDADSPFGTTAEDLAHLSSEGVNLVTLYVTQYIKAPNGSTVSAGRFTPPDQQISAVVALAHQAGMAVQLTPMLWTSNGYTWRGGVQPENRAQYWQSYDAMILHYAALAQSDGVELFSIGSENDAVDTDVWQWTHLAAAVRGVYSGLTTYMTTTTDLRKVRFWHSVDLIGLSPYYSLSTKLRPSYAELRQAWVRWMRYVAGFARKYHRPVLFNEVGYQSALGTATYPWRAPTGTPSEGLQADAYAAILDSATQSWLRGIVFYKWTTPVVDPTLDRGYSPRGKQAECAYASRWAPASTPRLSDGSPLPCLAGFVDKAIGGS